MKSKRLFMFVLSFCLFLLMVNSASGGPAHKGFKDNFDTYTYPGMEELLADFTDGSFQDSTDVRGETVMIKPAGEANWQEMVISEAFVPAAPVTPRVIPYQFPPETKEILAENIAEQITSMSPLIPLAPPSILDNFLGLGDNNVSIPPDTMGAAGPNHLMVMLNTQVRIQDKTGGNISTVTLDTFWTNGTGLSGDSFDPKLIYDSLSNRWMATVMADSRSSSSAVWFAISDTSDPTGNWTYYEWDADPAFIDWTWADFPGFGVNSTWVAITANMFTSGGSFDGAKMWVIDKTSALSGGALTTTIFSNAFDTAGGYNGFTLQPAQTFDQTEATLFIIDGNRWSGSGVGILRISQITGTSASPIWSVIPGSTVETGSGFFWTTEIYHLTQADADQSGTSIDIETNNPRILNAVFRNGRLWTTHSGGYPRASAADQTVAVWYEINPGGMPTPVVQSGVVGGNAAGTHYFFPSISVNAENDVVLGFSYSDSTQFVEAAFTSRESTFPAGTMGPVITCKNGEDKYVKDFGSGSVRWGDYSATVVDPSDDLTFWTLQEYAETDVGRDADDDRWGTWWCKIQIDRFKSYLPLIMR